MGRKPFRIAANALTAFRAFAAVALLFLPVRAFSFRILYCLCGVSDMADGRLARASHCPSLLGEKADGAADFLFFTVCCVRLLPLYARTVDVICATAVIAVLRLVSAAISFVCLHDVLFSHSPGNKTTGLALFFMPPVAEIVPVTYLARIVCAVAFVCAAADALALARKCKSRKENTSKGVQRNESDLE